MNPQQKTRDLVAIMDVKIFNTFDVLSVEIVLWLR